MLHRNRFSGQKTFSERFLMEWPQSL